MNKAILMGRLTRDPEVRTVSNQIPVCSFTLAVDRRFRSASGEKQADFIPITAWRQQADFCSKYLRKGMRIVVVGSIQTRSWDDQEGKKRYATEVVADEVHFAESRRSEENYNASAGSFDDRRPAAPSAERPAAPGGDGFFPGPDDDTALPFDI